MVFRILLFVLAFSCFSHAFQTSIRALERRTSHCPQNYVFRRDRARTPRTTRIVPLRMLTDDDDGTDSASSDDSTTTLPTGNVRFLGRGANAVVRPGVVLVAPSHEFHHYYKDAAIFIFAMGEESDDGTDNDSMYVIRGVIIDHPTPFTLEEMMDSNPLLAESPMKDNFLFRGGDTGGDQVIMLHPHAHIGQSAISTSGGDNTDVYQGGFDAALEACKQDGEAIDPLDFKLFFNYCEFTEEALEEMLDSNDGDGETNDQWISVEVDADFVLNGDWDRGDACKRLRTIVNQQMQKLKP